MSELAFSLISPSREVFAGAVEQVDLPGREGDFGVLAEHSAFITSLKAGVLQIHGEDNSAFFLFGGIAEVSGKGLSVLTPQAILLAELTAERITEEVAKIDAQLKDAPASRQAELTQRKEALQRIKTN